MPHISHNSLVSSQDKDGFCHTYSIDPQVCYRNPHSSTYKCKARSSSGSFDPRDGAILLAKFSENMKDGQSEIWAEREVEKARIAQEIAEKFNHKMLHLKRIHGDYNLNLKDSGNQDIEFQVPQTSKLENVSFFDRRRKKYESFIVMNNFLNFEKFVSVEFEKSEFKKKKLSKLLKKTKSNSFPSVENISSGENNVLKRNRSSSEGDTKYSTTGEMLNFCHHCGCCDQSVREFQSFLPHPTLHAFIHYFFCQSEGKMVIDCLEGEYSCDDGYKLTVPVIHSVGSQFGIHDRGLEGIHRVIKNHVCTDLCKHLPGMSINQTTPMSCANHHKEKCLNQEYERSPYALPSAFVQFQLSAYMYQNER